MNENQQAGNAPAQAPAAVPQHVAQPVAQPIAQPQYVAPAPVQPAVLPDAAADRTKDQFEKLLDSNRRLYEANESLRTEIQRQANANQLFNQPQPVVQPRPVAQPQIDPADFVDVDPVTGEQYINEGKLKARISDSDAKATQLQQQLNQYIQQQEQREVERQSKEAYSVFPELNPGGTNFDDRLYKQTRAILYDSMINPRDYGNRALSFREAAELIKGATPAQAQAVAQKVEAANQAIDGQPAAPAAQELKEQGSFQAPSQPDVQNRQALANDEELRALQLRTRTGDDAALAQRIMGTDHTKHD